MSHCDAFLTIHVATSIIINQMSLMFLIYILLIDETFRQVYLLHPTENIDTLQEEHPFLTVFDSANQF